MQRFFRNDQQRRIGAGNRGRALLLSHQAGFFAEDFTLPQRSQGIFSATLVAHDADFAAADPVEFAIFARILFENLLSGADALDADAAHEVFEFVLVQLAAQIEQTRNDASSRPDGPATGD